MPFPSLDFARRAHQCIYSRGGTTALANIATSSLGLLTTNVAEGTNLYYTRSRVAGVIAGTTTTALGEGNNLYFTNARADARFNATSTIGTITSLPSLGTVAIRSRAS